MLAKLQGAKFKEEKALSVLLLLAEVRYNSLAAMLCQGRGGQSPVIAKGLMEMYFTEDALFKAQRT